MVSGLCSCFSKVFFSSSPLLVLTIPRSHFQPSLHNILLEFLKTLIKISYFPDLAPEKITRKKVLIIEEKIWEYQKFSILWFGTSLIFQAQFLLKFLVNSVVASYQIFYWNTYCLTFKENCCWYQRRVCQCSGTQYLCWNPVHFLPVHYSAAYSCMPSIILFFKYSWDQSNALFCLDHNSLHYLWMPHSEFASNSVLPQLDRFTNRLLPGLLLNRPIKKKNGVAVTLWF